MNGILRISSPISEPWTAWIMLFLLMCIAIIYSRETGYMKNLLHGFITQMERSYGDSSVDVVSMIVKNIYKIGILAMAVYLCEKTEGQISFVEYLIVAGVILGILWLKRVVVHTIIFVFELKHSMVVPIDAYNGLWMIMCLILYPLLLVLIYFNLPRLVQIAMGIMLFIYIVMLLIRLFRSCMIKPISAFYILLYVLTVELLPIGCLFAGVKHLIAA